MINHLPGPESVTSLDRLEVRYGKTVAVDGVTLAIPKGAVYALLGRNGAGKSSIIRCLLGQQKPTGGKIFLLGEESWKGRTKLMERVGVVPEDPDAPPAMTAAQVIRFASRLYPSWDETGVAMRLERFAIPTNTPFGRLSKGQKAQVALTIALGPSPELLVFDDPTLGLDVVARRAVFEELIVDLAERGTTVFMTTHDLAGIEGIADRVGILSKGKLILDEPMETLKSRYRRIRFTPQNEAQPTREGSLGTLRPVRLQVHGWGVESVVSNYEDGVFERLQHSQAFRDAEASAMSLEEIFVAVSDEARGDER